jgi:hypothetical protein
MIYAQLYFYKNHLSQGRQKIKVGQTFLTGKAINSEIIIDDIEVITENKGDSVFGEVTNIKRVK